MQFTETWVTSISFYKSLVYIRPTAFVFVMLRNRLATQLSCFRLYIRVSMVRGKVREKIFFQGQRIMALCQF